MKSLFLFLVNAAALGIGLAMDAFSVSLANGLHEPRMKNSRMILIALVFGLFQFLMPLTGWVCIHTIAAVFTSFTRFIPWIALLLLLYLGIHMLIEGLRPQKEETAAAVGFGGLMLQGIATSIDALSVGFTIASNPFSEALTESLIIGVLTFCICLGGLVIGKKFGTKLSGKASVLGGIILIIIGIEIFFTA